MKRILVCGGRNFNQGEFLFRVLDHYQQQAAGFAVLIHGAATGADTLADRWARTRGVRVEPYPAAWDDLTTPPVNRRYRRDGMPYNAAAGGIRNAKMLVEGKPDVVICFPDGKGTTDMWRRAREARVFVIWVAP